jgi:hypothetical protein
VRGRKFSEAGGLHLMKKLTEEAAGYSDLIQMEAADTAHA